MSNTKTPSKDSTGRRGHGDYFDFLAHLPPSHREKAVEFKPDMTSQVQQIAVVEGLIREPQLTEIGNMIQLAIGQDLTQKKSAVRYTDTSNVVQLDPSYAQAAEVLGHAINDLAGPQLLRCDEFMHQIDDPDTGRWPTAEMDDIKKYRKKDVDPRVVKRAWILAINGPHDYQGGYIYFPTKMVVIKLLAGAALIFNPTLPYGVTPVERGTRRFMKGWAKSPMTLH